MDVLLSCAFGRNPFSRDAKLPSRAATVEVQACTLRAGCAACARKSLLHCVSPGGGGTKQDHVFCRLQGGYAAQIRIVTSRVQLGADHPLHRIPEGHKCGQAGNRGLPDARLHAENM